MMISMKPSVLLLSEYCGPFRFSFLLLFVEVDCQQGTNTFKDRDVLGSVNFKKDRVAAFCEAFCGS